VLCLRCCLASFRVGFFEPLVCMLFCFGTRVMVENTVQIVYECVLYSLRRFVHCLARQSRAFVWVLYEGVLMMIIWRSRVW
jgi:hypothetical protein